MIMNNCDEWRPPSISSRHAVSDPTANAAIRQVDEVDGRLRALQAEERELIDLIGEGLAIIEGICEGLGEKYARIIEWRYIDRLSWDYIRDEYGIAKSSGNRFMHIAFDWVDSIGVARILRKDFEI